MSEEKKPLLNPDLLKKFQKRNEEAKDNRERLALAMELREELARILEKDEEIPSTD